MVFLESFRAGVGFRALSTRFRAGPATLINMLSSNNRSRRHGSQTRAASPTTSSSVSTSTDPPPIRWTVVLCSECRALCSQLDLGGADVAHQAVLDRLDVRALPSPPVPSARSYRGAARRGRRHRSGVARHRDRPASQPRRCARRGGAPSSGARGRLRAIQERRAGLAPRSPFFAICAQAFPSGDRLAEVSAGGSSSPPG
jgi:hypothetical protein